MIPLHCPTCRSLLTPGETTLACSCGRSFDVVEGIPVLTSSAKYYGEVSLERKQAVLNLMDQGHHWRSVVWESFGTSYPFLHHIIVDEARNDFRYVLPWLKDGVALDLGAGWGTMSVHFARDYRQVIAMDGTLDRVQFIQKRCRQDGVSNVECICANVLESVLPDRFFDIVLMNGVLEWIGESSPTGDPRDLQLAALRAVRRMLKPDGVLYVGIENSHGFKYLVGDNDDHTGIPHITYLTRDAADAKARRDLKHPYRTYTYDRDGYQRLLSEGGFPHARYFYPAPDYKSVNVLMDLEGPGQISFYNRELKPPAHPSTTAERVRSLELHAEARGHAADYAASYSIVAGTPSARSLVSAVADHVRDSWQTLLPAGCPAPSRVDVLQVSSATGKRFERGRLKLFVFVDGKPDPTLVATVCRHPEYDFSLEREAAIYQLPSLCENQVFAVPALSAFVPVLGRPVLFRRAWRGTSFETALGRLRHGPAYDPARLESAVRADFAVAGRMLDALHQTTREAGHSTPAYIASVCREVAVRWPAGLYPQLAEVREAAETVYADAADCLVHGDFTPSNIFRLEEPCTSRDVGLIDWELSSRHGATIVDYGRFVYYYVVLIESLQTELGKTREDLLRQVFITREGWLSEAVLAFLAGAFPGGRIEPAKARRLVQFALLHDVLIQCDHSAHPMLKLGRNFAKYYGVVGGD